MARAPDQLKWIGVVVTLITLIFGAGITWSALQAQVKDHDKRLTLVEEEATQSHDAVPLIRKDIEAVQKDVTETQHQITDMQADIKVVQTQQVEQRVLLTQILTALKRDQLPRSSSHE